MNTTKILLLACLLLAGGMVAAPTAAANPTLGGCTGTIDTNCGVGPGFCHIYVRHTVCLVFT